jgi:hypothetical protein
LLSCRWSRKQKPPEIETYIWQRPACLLRNPSGTERETKLSRLDPSSDRDLQGSPPFSKIAVADPRMERQESCQAGTARHVASSALLSGSDGSRIDRLGSLGLLRGRIPIVIANESKEVGILELVNGGVRPLDAVEVANAHRLANVQKHMRLVAPCTCASLRDCKRSYPFRYRYFSQEADVRTNRQNQGHMGILSTILRTDQL